MKHCIHAAQALGLLLLLVFPASEAIQCSDVTKDLVPCTGYLKGSTATPSSACCSGISTLASAASTTADRRAACSCLQSLAQQINPNPAAAKALPASCGLSLPYAISPKTDCSTFMKTGSILVRPWSAIGMLVPRRVAG